MNKRHAEIVGAGFAGLSAACALAQRGWSVRVHERADALRTTGAGIYIYENGLRVLEALGAYDAAVKGAPFAHTREVRDDHNNVISVHRWGGSRVFSIVRQTVINALAEQARKAGVEIVTNSAGAIASTDGELMTARRPEMQGGSDRRRRRRQFAAARRVRPDREAQSAGRRLHAAADPQDSGGDAVAGRRDHDRILVGQPPRALHAVQRDRGLYRAGHARQRRDGEGGAGRQGRLEALVPASRAADRPAAACEGRYDRFELIRLKRWSEGKVAVIGDAAHALPPNIGQGGGCAMMNALALAVHLDREKDVPKALAEWERAERPITDHTQRVSVALGWPATWPPKLRALRFVARRQIEMGGEAAHQDGAAPADGT